MFRRILAAIVILATALALLVVAWPQLFGVAQLPVLAQLVSLRAVSTSVGLGVVALLALVALFVAAARRFAGSMALIVLVFCLINLAVLSARGFGDTTFAQATDRDMTVLSWNTLGDRPGADTIAQLAIESGADIVVLPETSRAAGEAIASRMGDAGLPMVAHTASYDEISKARSTTLLISDALGEYTVDELAETTTVLPSVVARPADGTGPTIIAVHVVAPIEREMANWREDLQWIKNACVGGDVIMVGDFNSTLDHFAGLGTTSGAAVGECFDAAVTTDNAAVGTWPATFPALLGAPIDHVMSTPNWLATGMRVVEAHDESGSDHRPIVAQLTPAD
ncbi:MAG: endonuclease/exonuclease/phosphatase family protein [Rhodoglobus sp.]